MAETTTTTSLPSFLAPTIRSATRFMCAAEATEEPPYFWTTRAPGPQATDVRRTAGGCVPATRALWSRDGLTGAVAAQRPGAREPRHHAARLDGRQPRRATAARQYLLRPAPRGGPVAECRRPPVLHRLARRSGRAPARRGADRRRAVHRGGQARGVRARPGVALAHV